MLAQYGVGGTSGGGMPGNPTYDPNRGYGSKGAIIAGVIGGAAVLGACCNGGTMLQGCVDGDGDKLVNERDNQTYSLTNTEGETPEIGSARRGARQEAQG